MFKRKIYQELVKWKNSSAGKTALLVEGARRIGKSTVVEEFAKNEYESYILINFQEVSSDVKRLFEDVSDLNYIFLQLQLIFKVNLVERKSIIIFDEVQLCPVARQAIKTLVKDGRYDYIETGSLISIKKNVQNILIPSEERKIAMYPMDFEEFQWALGDEVTSGIIKIFFYDRKPLGDATHRKLMRDFRLYMLVGGMPQAVSSYIETNNLSFVDEVKRDILNIYEDDLRKVDSTGRLSLLFDSIPAQLSKHSSGFAAKTTMGNPNMSDENMLELLAELKDSKIVLFTYRPSNPEIDLSSYIDLSKFRIYMADTGLFVTFAFKNKNFTENSIYEKLLSDKLDANLGFVYENVVAQTLAAKGDRLYYFTFENAEVHRNYEIDFMIARDNKICPIEVKSSNYRTHSSIDRFYEKYSRSIGQRYIIHTKDLSKDKDIICIPTYMTQFL